MATDTMLSMRVSKDLNATEAELNSLATVVAGTMQPSKSIVPSSVNGLTMVRSAGSYGYGLNFDGDAVFNIAGSAQKSYVMQITGDRDSAYAVTGDSNDAILKISGNNYAANDANFILRGLNVSVNNRSGGTLGRIEHSFGTQNKSGGTSPIVLGATITAENYGTCADLFGGLDILLKNEASVATTEFGLRIRNENNSVADAVGAGILFSDTGANTGFDYLIDGNGSSVVVADIRLQNAMVINNDEADRTMIGAVIGICNDASPASNAPASGVVLYFDGTDLKAKDSSGQTATLNNAAFS
jgi:hypothetical protein